MKLIFIHGSGGSKESFQYQTQFFNKAEAIDLPGHPKGNFSSSIEGYVEWLHGYIHRMKYKDVVLAGHSLGAGITLLFALNYPEDLKGIISIGGGARLRVHPMFLEVLEKAVSNPNEMPEFIDAGMELIDPALKEILKRRAIENGPAVALNDMRACDNFDIMNRVNEIKVPTLAICGSMDQMTPPKYSKYLVDKIPGASAVIIEGGTHLAFAEKPDEVNQVIEKFLKSLKNH